MPNRLLGEEYWEILKEVAACLCSVCRRGRFSRAEASVLTDPSLDVNSQLCRLPLQGIGGLRCASTKSKPSSLTAAFSNSP